MGALTVIAMQVLGTLCGAVIAMRAISVIGKMDMRARQEHYLSWLAFGIAYALLAVAAVGATMTLWSNGAQASDLVWLGASAGLILFDRRRREPLPPAKKAQNPDETVPLGGTLA